MTRDEKLQAIKDMGIDLKFDCPFDYGFNSRVTNCDESLDCGDCFIKVLED